MSQKDNDILCDLRSTFANISCSRYVASLLSAAANEIEKLRRLLNGCMDHEQITEQRNIGASIFARMITEIARTGKHEGVFGGKDEEEAAQAVLKLCKSHARDEVVKECAAFAETWGDMPPSPLSRRKRLADDMRRTLTSNQSATPHGGGS